MQLRKVRSKINGIIVYFRFFSEQDENEFWYTKTTESVGFCSSNMNCFEPIDTTWDELRNLENESK